MSIEQDIVEKAVKGDRNAFAQLYEKHFDRIYRYVYLRLGNRTETEDLTQEVFIRALEAIGSYKWRSSPFAAWLYRIAHNLAVDHYRRQPAAPQLQLDEELIQDGSSVDAEVAMRLSRQRLGPAMQQLTPDQQQVLSLRFGQQLTAREVSEIMDKSVGAVEALQHRALRTLHRILEEE